MSFIGLCATCHYIRPIQTAKGSRFYLCERSKVDGRFPKYPPLPVLACRGWEAKTKGEQTDDNPLPMANE